MAEYTALAPLFTDIANAIRSKTGETGAITANSFPNRIANLWTGGGSAGTYTNLSSLFSDIATQIRDKDNTTAKILASDFPSRIKALNFPMPAKGSLIQMNLDGTDRQYRVLKTTGTVAEVMETAPCVEGSSGVSRQYTWPFGSEVSCGQYLPYLGTYIMNSIYPTFTTQAKNAIVPKAITQDYWWYNSKKWWGKEWGDSSIITGTQTIVNQEIYGLQLQNTNWAAIGTVPIYVPSVSELYDYLKDHPVYSYVFYSTNITDMYLRGEDITDWRKDTFYLRTYGGERDGGDDDPDSQSIFTVQTRNYSVHPSVFSLGDQYSAWILLAFQIDLTKIPFTIV